MRQLRAKFLFDLEEALQERDARQILRLIREFNFRKNELERQKNEERRDINEQRNQELRDLQDQRAQRIRELEIEYSFRQKKLIDEFKFERDAEARDHAQKIQEIKIRAQERNQELLRRYQDEHDLTAQQLKMIGDMLNGYFGPNGYVDGIYAYYIQSTANTFAQIRALMNLGAWSAPIETELPPKSSEKTIPSPIKSAKKSYKKSGPYAEGGTLLANTPTMALFGERGPERVDFTPLTHPGANVGKVFGSTSSGNAQGRVQIEILLSKGLEAAWMNKLKTEIADVIIKSVK
jgi:hypothetical protein